MSESADFFTSPHPRSLEGDLKVALEEFSRIRDEYKLDEIEHSLEQDFAAHVVERELHQVLASRAIFPIGERIDVSGQMVFAKERRVVGFVTDYNISKTMPTKNHIDARVKGLRVMPLPTLELFDDIRQYFIYNRRGLYINFGLSLAVDQMAIITPATSENGVDSVWFNNLSEGLLPVGYPGLVVTTSMPREAVIARYPS